MAIGEATDKKRGNGPRGLNLHVIVTGEIIGFRESHFPFTAPNGN